MGRIDFRRGSSNDNDDLIGSFSKKLNEIDEDKLRLTKRVSLPDTQSLTSSPENRKKGKTVIYRKFIYSNR